MRILVYPHELAIGGSQINAVDLAAAAARAGHEVVVYGVPGPLTDYIREQGLRFIAAPSSRMRPSPVRIAQLLKIAKAERLDLIHCYEWPPCLDAYYGAGLALGVPVLCTVLSMWVMPYVPASVPLIMGTAALRDEAARLQSAPVWQLEPPIDTDKDHPGIDAQAFRREHRIPLDQPLLVTVSRLALDLKLDALVRAINAADLLAAKLPLRLAIVGDGPARSALQARADDVNRRWGRRVIQFTGAIMDPRQAYAAADVVLGMGSSALRALSIGRPLVVQGELGFSLAFEPSSLNHFLRQGFFGVGSGQSDEELATQTLRLLSLDQAAKSALSRFCRQIVVDRFSLGRAWRIQLDIYEQVARLGARYPLRDALVAARRALWLEIKNRSPGDKRRRRAQERLLLSAAGRGSWPPANA